MCRYCKVDLVSFCRDPHPHFSFLGPIRELFKTGKPTYPVERTLVSGTSMPCLILVTTNICLGAPHLNITYDLCKSTPTSLRTAEGAQQIGET